MERQYPSQEELTIFVGVNASFYLEKWRRMLASGWGWAGWNWSAFFLQGGWFMYRKMWKWAVAYHFIANFPLRLLYLIPHESRLAAAIVSILCFGALGLLCATFANRVYLEHARKRIAEVNTQADPSVDLANQLSTSGGTSLLYLFVYSIPLFALGRLWQYLASLGYLPKY